MSEDNTVSLELYADPEARKLISRDGSPLNLNPVTLGDRLLCTLRPMKALESGEYRERDLPVRTIAASLGKTLEPPTAGTFKLRGAGGDSAAIALTATAEQLAAALTPILSEGAPTETRLDSPGCWLFRIPSGAKFILSPGPDNYLDPISIVRVRHFEKYAGQWWAEVRLVQAPLAFNTGFERVLPPPPSFRRIRAGQPETEIDPPVNEIQALTIPADFRGTYFVRWNGRKTRILGIQDGPDQLAEALNLMFPGSTQSRFSVEVPETDNAYIEFTGPLGGAPQPLAEVEVSSFQPGTLTFLLPLDRAEMHAALRNVKEIEAPFEVEVELGDPAHPETPGRKITLFSAPLKVVREQIFLELETVQRLDWQHPPTPRDYIPYTPDQVLFGVQHYTASFPSPASEAQQRDFLFPHNLGTEAVHVTVRENKSAGRILVPGKDYTLSPVSDVQMSLTIPPEQPARAVNALAILISSAGPVSVFLAHTHTMNQILGLLDALASVTGRLDALEDLLPTSSLARRDRPDPQDIELPDRAELYPGRLPALDPSKLKDAKQLATLTLPRPAALLPAVHDATVTNLPSPLPSPLTNAGNVFVNAAATPVLIPGGGGRRAGYVENGGHVATDGRFWYRVAKAGASNSFFPVDLERELFLLHINEAMWQPGESVNVAFDVDLQLLAANTRAQMVVVIEAGTAPGQATPAPTAANLEKIEWAAEPLLVQRVVLSSVRVKHHFGAQVKRSAQNVLTADRLNYTAWSSAPAASVPSAPGIVLRGRLIQFDTENNVKGASGFICYSFSEAKAQIA